MGLGKERWVAAGANASLGNVKCVATEGQVVIEFDVDAARWGRTPGGCKMLVRLFDRNGQYLTHFITAERFVAYEDDRNFGWAGQKLLVPKGNRLVYDVNVRDLRDVNIAEIGFFKEL